MLLSLTRSFTLTVPMETISLKVQRENGGLIYDDTDKIIISINKSVQNKKTNAPIFSLSSNYLQCGHSHVKNKNKNKNPAFGTTVTSDLDMCCTR